MTAIDQQLDDAWTHPGDGGLTGIRHGAGVVAVSSTASPSRPEVNEDRAAVIPMGSSGLLIAVADGCGGMPAGDRASIAAIQAMASAVRGTDESDLLAGVLAGFDAANRAVSDLRVGAGSTLTAVLITPAEARVFYAGDSPAAVVGQRGAVRFATLAHSLTGYGVEAGLMTEAEAAAHEDSGLVLNVLGFPEMFVHVGPPVRLRAMDTIIVASDGLSDNLPMSEIARLCRTGSAAAALRSLVDHASLAMSHASEGHPDDLTIALYRPTRRRGD